MTTRTLYSGAAGLQTRGLFPARQHNKSRCIPAAVAMTFPHIPEIDPCHPGESRDPVSSSPP
ncbi:MAG: hypothetical protein AB1752_13375, partial [Candidatus Zixiibacteriota bacterium]